MADLLRSQRLASSRLASQAIPSKVILFDGAREARATYVIWPDNLFENGSLRDYAGPFTGNFGYDGREIDEPTPDPHSLIQRVPPVRLKSPS